MGHLFTNAFARGERSFIEGVTVHSQVDITRIVPCTIKRENADLAGTWLKCVAELVCGNSFIREKAIKAARLPLQYMRYCHDIINILELPELHWICR